MVPPPKTTLCLALRTASFTLNLRGAASAAAGELHRLIGLSGTECAFPVERESDTRFPRVFEEMKEERWEALGKKY